MARGLRDCLQEAGIEEPQVGGLSEGLEAGRGREFGESLRSEARQGASRSEAGANDWVSLGLTLPAVQRKMIDKIKHWQYVDFTTLPPAEGLRRKPTAEEGGLVLVNAADWSHNRRLIPDFSMWVQCYAIWMAIAVQVEPHRHMEYLAYLSEIADTSR